MKPIRELLSVDEAVGKLVEVFERNIRLGVEEVDLLNSMNRILVEDFIATSNRPRYDISAVDGYAVRSIDLVGASLYNPIKLRIKGISRPGMPPVEIDRGETIRVHTGAPIPRGSDAVVMDEDVEIRGNEIAVYRPIPRGSNVVLKGEDFREGELLATRGSIIKPHLIGILAANGVGKVKVYRKIKISLIPIGDELIEPGSVYVEGREYSSSTYLIYTTLLRDGLFDVEYPGIIPDNLDILVKTILREIEKGVDIVITIGGTGVSESDIVAEFTENTGETVFRGVKIRPGRPTSCTLFNGKIIIHLSGFPVAAWTGYEVILRRAVINWLGISGLERRVVNAILTKRTPGVPGYRSVIRVRVFNVDNVVFAEPYMLRGSGVLSSLLKTNGYIVIPEDIEGFDKNTVIPVYLYD